MNDNYGKINDLCSNLSENFEELSCYAIAQEMKQHVLFIQRNDINLRDLFKVKSSNRAKRGFGNWLGSGLKYLFGVMDHDDELEVREKLDELDENDKNHLNLLEQQITISKANLETIMEPIQKIETHNNEMAIAVNGIIQECSTLKLRYYNQSLVNSLREKINILINDYTLKLIKIEEDQMSTLNIISGLRNNKLHPSLLTMEDLKSIIQQIPNNNQELNQDVLEQHHLVQLLDVNYFEAEGNILIKLKIPLVGREKFSLRKPIPLPFHVNSSYYVVSEKTKYISVNGKNSSFYFMDTLDDCKIISLDFEHQVYVCRKTQPLTVYDKTICVMALYYNPFSNIINCPLKPITRITNTFVRLHRESTWLFQMITPQKIIIECNDVRNVETLYGNGIIHFTSGCIIATEQFSIKVNKDSKAHFTLPEYNEDIVILPTLQEEHQQQINLNTTKEVEILDLSNYHENIIKRTRELDALQMQTRLEEQGRLHERHQTKMEVHTFSIVVTLTILTLIVIVVIIVVIKLRSIRSIISFLTEGVDMTIMAQQSVGKLKEITDNQNVEYGPDQRENQIIEDRTERQDPDKLTLQRHKSIKRNPRNLAF